MYISLELELENDGSTLERAERPFNRADDQFLLCLTARKKPGSDARDCDREQ